MVYVFAATPTAPSHLCDNFGPRRRVHSFAEDDGSKDRRRVLLGVPAIDWTSRITELAALGSLLRKARRCYATRWVCDRKLREMSIFDPRCSCKRDRNSHPEQKNAAF